MSYTIDGTGIFTYIYIVDFYGKLVGKYTVRPMDPMGAAVILSKQPC